MDFCDKNLRRFLLASQFIMLAFSAARIVLVKNYIVYSTVANAQGYELERNGYTIAFSVLVIVLIAVFGVFAYTRKCDSTPEHGYEDAPTIFFSALIGFMMAATAVLYAYNIFTGAVSLNGKSGVTDKLTAASIVFLLLSAVYFLFTSSRAKKDNNPLYTLLTVFPIIYSVLRVLIVFIPISDSVADTPALFRLFGLSFTMMYFVAEIKAKNGAKNEKNLIFFGLSAMLLTMLFAIPDLLLSAFWILKSFSFNSILTAIDLFVTMFIFARLLSLTTRSDKNTVNNSEFENL